jgi:hypothetical protein
MVVKALVIGGGLRPRIIFSASIYRAREASGWAYNVAALQLHINHKGASACPDFNFSSSSTDGQDWQRQTNISTLLALQNAAPQV